MNTALIILDRQHHDLLTIQHRHDEEWGRGDLTDEEHSTKRARIRIQIEALTELREALVAKSEEYNTRLITVFNSLSPFAHPDLCVELPSNGGMGGGAPLYARNNAMVTIGDCRTARDAQESLAQLLDGE